MQEVAVVFVSKLSMLRDPAAFRPWLRRSHQDQVPDHQDEVPAISAAESAIDMASRALNELDSTA